VSRAVETPAFPSDDPFAEVDALAEKRRLAQPKLTDNGKLTAQGRAFLQKVRAVPNYWKWDHIGPVAVVLTAAHRENAVPIARPREAAPARSGRGGASRGGDSGDKPRPSDEDDAEPPGVAQGGAL
jgi:hypothetical protein